MHRAAFIDKDGTLIENVPFNVDPGRIVLAPGAAEGLRLLARAGFRLFVVSNQSGVARGYFGVEALGPVERRVRELLGAEGVGVEAFYWCPHLAEGVVPEYAVRCTCRKPEPGMLLRAAAEHDVDLRASWLVGDILNDVEAAHRAGCRGVLLANGGETQWVITPPRVPDAFASDLAEAAQMILARETSEPAHERDANG